MPTLSWPSLFSSDALVLLALLLIALASLKLLPLREIYDTVNSRVSPPFSVQHAVNSYSQYSRLSKQELGRMRASYTRLLSWQQKRVAYDMGYTKKLNRYAEVIDLNAQFFAKVCSLAESQYGVSPLPGAGDLTRVRESLRHLVRDWSAEGARERQITYASILSALETLSLPQGSSILLPGAGLSRLAYELALRGYAATACELSAYQNLLFHLVRSCSQANQYSIYPYAHWFSHSLSSADLFRPVQIPDVVPTHPITLLSADFLSLPAQPTHDALITLFFIDTSTNLLSTLTHIHALLKPGGTWINLGPLLWTPGQQAAMECSLGEVLWASERTGFVFEEQAGGGKTRTVECEYTADPRAMMRWVYRAEFWVARKA